jgi:phospholipid N-methyltransferase
MNNNLKKLIELSETYDFLKPDPYIKDFLDSLIEGKLIESVDKYKIKYTFSFTYFTISREIIGFVTPTLEWSRTMKRLIGKGTVLEVGAGTGLLAKYLNSVGVNIIATDDFSWHKRKDFSWNQYFEVKKLDFKEAIRKYRADYLLLCWPPYNSSFAREAAELFTKLNPSGQIIYIGEIRGCTADDEFHDNIIRYDLPEEINDLYPQWVGIHDNVYLVSWVRDSK